MSAQPTAGGTYARHAEASAELLASQRELFDFLDDHRNLSSHMESSRSPMMAGGTMQLILDEQQGRQTGSHLVMRGKVMGFELFVDEIVVERVPPAKKAWETVDARLVVIGPYRLGFRITERAPTLCVLTVWIDYDLPTQRRWLGVLGGSMYARWCVQQMLGSASAHFADAR